MTSLGDRMKGYEHSQQQSFLPGLPVIVRLDGKGFHRWTRLLGCARPFDPLLMSAFDSACCRLMEESGALVGYTQSDEISLLLWRGEDYKSQIYCEGKPAKLITVLSSLCTAEFCRIWPGSPALFDARAFAVSGLDEARNYFLWRSLDCEKNSVSMVAEKHFSPNQLKGKSTEDRRGMLFQWEDAWENYPVRCRLGGSFVRKRSLRELAPEELERIPEKHRPAGPVERSRIEPVESWEEWEGWP